MQLQILQRAPLESKAAGEFRRNLKDVTLRADILDRRGRVLAHSIPAWSCFVDKTMMGPPGPLAAKLEPVLRMTSGELMAKLKAPGRTAQLKRGMTFAEVAKLKELRLPCVGVTAGQERVHPNGDLALNLLGKVDAEGSGLSGMESAFDETLKGRHGRLEMIRDGSGRMIYEKSHSTDAPEPLRLTIDRDFQYYSEQALQEARRRFSIQSGIVAVQNPSTGEILAMAAYPPTPLKNPFIQDSFEPGSTFKIVGAAAALAEGLAAETDGFFCENGRYQLAPGVVITDHERQGWLTLSGILEHSSNIGMAKIAAKLGRESFYRYARALGFGGRTGVPLAGETAGTLKSGRAMTDVALAGSSYGYGVAVSGMQLLGAYSAIANGGTLLEPRLVLDSRKPEAVRRVAPEKTVAALASMLESVVERGTGIQAQVEGYRVAGKTGTARMLNKASKTYFTDQYISSFIGFLPASAPRWTILVVLENPRGAYYGSQVAAPLFANLARELLALESVAPDRSQAPRLVSR